MVPCTECGLRSMPLFRPFDRAELCFVESMKADELTLRAGQEVFPHGHPSSLYTLYSGWAYRSTPLGRGDGQITQVLLPGDLIGLQAVMARGERVRALTEVVLCHLSGRELEEMVAACPKLFLDLFRVVVLSLREADEHQASLGQRDALQRLACFLLEIFDRLEARGMTVENRCALPLQRRHLAAHLGLSGTHVRRTLDELDERGLAVLAEGTLHILDREGLVSVAAYPPDGTRGARRAII